MFGTRAPRRRSIACAGIDRSSSRDRETVIRDPTIRIGYLPRRRAIACSGLVGSLRRPSVFLARVIGPGRGGAPSARRRPEPREPASRPRPSRSSRAFTDNFDRGRWNGPISGGWGSNRPAFRGRSRRPDPRVREQPPPTRRSRPVRACRPSRLWVPYSQAEVRDCLTDRRGDASIPLRDRPAIVVVRSARANVRVLLRDSQGPLAELRSPSTPGTGRR